MKQAELNLHIQSMIRTSGKDLYGLYSEEQLNHKTKLLLKLAQDKLDDLFPFEKDNILKELQDLLRGLIQIKHSKQKALFDPIVQAVTLELITTTTKTAIKNLLVEWQKYRQEQSTLKRAEKEKKFAAFESKDHVDSVLSRDAYQQTKKAILIGGMASGSRPYHLEKEDQDRMPSEELTKAVTSLAKKHQPTFAEMKERYKAVWGEKSPLRASYSGADNASRGALYSQLRVGKYMERAGMKEAIIQHIGSELGSAKGENINQLMAEAQAKFNKQLEQLITTRLTLAGNSKKQFAMMKCLTTLASASQTLPIGEMDEPSKIIQTIAMMEIGQLFLNLQNKDNMLSLADYYQAMALLNVAIIKRLLLIPDEDLAKEHFFKDIVTPKLTTEGAEREVSETLVGNSCTEALSKSLIALDMEDRTTTYGKALLKLSEAGLPGFPLEGVKEGTMRHGYFEFNGQSGSANAKKVQPSDTCALIGRDTDTLYCLDVQSPVFKKTIESMEVWAKSDPKPKTLVVDLTIPTIEADPILNAILEMRNGQLADDSFDILLVRSEQKQQTLGTGKFAAGSACLISNNRERLAQFNLEAKKPRTADQTLASFYRENVSEAVSVLLEAQCDSARKYVASQREGALIANGPLVFSKKIGYKSALPQGSSFGFFVKSASTYTDVTRIDPGLGEDEEPSRPELS